jgi:hypothetical protein
MSLFILVGCGGGVSNDTPTNKEDENKDKFTLQVGNISIDSESSISSRLSGTVYEGASEVETVSMNEEGTITLEGSDAALFAILGGKVVFKQPAVVGVYDVDIKAVKGSKTVVVKRRYEVVQGLKSLMANKTLYVLLQRPNGDYAVHAATYNEDFNATVGEGAHSFVYDGAKTLTYPDATFVEFSKEHDDYLSAKVHKPDGNILDERFYFEEAKAINEYDDLSNTLVATKIVENSKAYFAPKIEKFSVRGSKKVEDGKVVLGDTIQMYAKLDGILDGDKVVRFALFNRSLSWDGYDVSGDSAIDPELKLDCQKNATQKKRYDCQIQTKSRMSDTWIAMEGNFFMDGSSLYNIAALGVMSCENNASDAPCHIAIIPAVQEVIEVNNSTTVNDGVLYDLNVSKDFTVSVWAKPSSVEDNVLITFHEAYHWTLQTLKSRIIAGSHDGENIGAGTSINVWKMFTIVKQGEKTMFYENGELVKTLQNVSYGKNYVWIAAGGHDKEIHNYKGLIDNIIVAEGAATKEEIKEFYERTKLVN